ncbi:uncharacterized protein [Nicotiana sylvestris]|uniref:uncharacterized protein n=1 Tax=Nicotiana sylvestris TaxID=4096 RepID=UPI00388C42AF
MGRLTKWQILLTEFDIIYVTQKAMKAQALADHLAENLVDEEYEPLRTYFPDEEVMHIDEVEQVEKPGGKLFFDGTANMKGVGIGAMLIYEIGHHYPITAQLSFYCTNNIAEYEACILGLKFRHIPRIHNEVADASATLASMFHHPNKAYVNPLHIQVRDQHAYCYVVEEELDNEPWFHDIREYIRMRVYPIQDTGDQKRTIRHLASGFFLSGGVLYKRTPDLGLLRGIDAKKGTTIMTEVVITDTGANLNSHMMKEVCQEFKITYRNSTPYRPKANGAVEAANKNIKKILQKMVQGSRQWHEKLHFALLGYRTTVRTSVGTTPYLLVYGTEVVIAAEVQIPSLWIVAKAKIDDDEWVKTRMEQLSLIYEKRLAVGQEISFFPRNPPWGKHVLDRCPPGEQGKTTRVSRIESNSCSSNQAPTWRNKGGQLKRESSSFRGVSSSWKSGTHLENKGKAVVSRKNSSRARNQAST